jgi:diaminopimelate decarboxylase
MLGGMDQVRAAVVLTEALAAGHLGEEQPLALFVDFSALDHQLAALRAAFPSGTLHALAIKACPVAGVLKRAIEAGFGLEAASRVELELALRLVEPARIVFDSPAKTPGEIARALRAGVGLNVDNLQELARVAALGPTPGVGLRVNPGVGLGAIAETSTAYAGSKFGVDLGLHRAEVIAAFCRHPWLTGLHVHVGSQGCTPDLLAAGAAALAGLADEIAAAGGRVEAIDIGGGLPVDYAREEEAPAFAAYAAALGRAAPALLSGRWRLVTEFGRHVFARAGWVASRVEYTKRSGERRIAVIHAGADLFLRQVLCPEAWSLRIGVHGPDGRPKPGVPEPWDIAGPLCFSGDLLARGRALPPIEPGDFVVVHDAGAYTLALWSRYNSRLSPAVLAHGPEGLTVLRRAESVDEVLRFWGL